MILTVAHVTHVAVQYRHSTELVTGFLGLGVFCCSSYPPHDGTDGCKGVYEAASINWGSLFWGSILRGTIYNIPHTRIIPYHIYHIGGSLFWGLYLGGPDVWKLSCRPLVFI